MKVRGRIAKDRLAEHQEPLDVPELDVRLLGVDIDREIKEVGHEHAAARLQHVEPFHNHHVRIPHHFELAWNDVVGQM